MNIAAASSLPAPATAYKALNPTAAICLYTMPILAYSPPLCIKYLRHRFLLAVPLFLAGSTRHRNRTVAQAPQSSDPSSSATPTRLQDVIMQRLELVGIRYRRGGSRPRPASTAAASSAMSSRKASA